MTRMFIASLCATSVIASPMMAQQAACPSRNADGMVVFADGSMAMRGPLAVNPDGTAGSYTRGDHGYTYIANGVDLIERGRVVSCRGGNSVRCRDAWLRAEAGSFAAGTPQFCVFAIEVEPITAGAAPVHCPGRSDRLVAGDGKGRPRTGAPLPTATGGSITPYLSMTSLHHRVGGEVRYVDSAAVPALVSPRPELRGAIAWVRFGDRVTFAIVGDTGPRFGEGTLALHQRLRTGTIGPLPALGPIPRESRCTREELSLRPPFKSSPDIDGDLCNSGHPVRGATDIRGYAGIRDGVETIILSRVTPPMRGTTVTQELTLSLLEATATNAGFSTERLASMADCLAR